jgi:hypothetical protein
MSGLFSIAKVGLFGWLKIHHSDNAKIQQWHFATRNRSFVAVAEYNLSVYVTSVAARNARASARPVW